MFLIFAMYIVYVCDFTLHFEWYIIIINYIQGIPKKRTFRMLLEPQCAGSITSSRHPLVSENQFFGRFLLRLSLIKPSQVIFTIKFSPTALNFGCDFVLLVHFFGTP